MFEFCEELIKQLVCIFVYNDYLLFLQHYMLNSSINEQLVAVADVKEGDIVLEIGPGTGSLTNVLVDSGATVLAIEKVYYLPFLCDLSFHQAIELKLRS